VRLGQCWLPSRLLVTMEKIDYTTVNWTYDDTSTYDGNDYYPIDEELSPIAKRNANHDALWRRLDRQFSYWDNPTLQTTYCNKIVRRMIFGACSRKYDRVRKYCKKRLL